MLFNGKPMCYAANNRQSNNKTALIKCKFFILLVVCAFFSSPAYAQLNQFQFSRLDISNGLSHNQVNCIYKDSKGFVWLGTLSGLNKYDGYKIKVFKHADNDSTSISDDFVVSIIEGPGNKLWVETRNGFNIYDPSTEKFNHDVKGYLHSIHIPDANITSLKKDRFGNFWFLHATQGVYKYEPSLHKLTHLEHRYSDDTSIYSNTVADLSIDSKGNVWIIYSSGVLEKLDPRSYKVVSRSHYMKNLPLGLSTTYKVFIDRQDDLWCFTPSYSSGVYFFNHASNVVKHFDKGPGQLNTNVISNVIQDDKNRLWIATDHGGINVLDKHSFKIQYLLNREDDDKTVGQNSIIMLYKDDTGIIWVGTYKRGVSYYHERIIKFPLYTHHLSDPASLPFSDVNNFAEDKTGNLWLGTNGGGLIYFDRRKGTFKSYLHDPNNKNSLVNNVVVCLFIDHEQKLWIGTYFGGLDCFDGKTFTHYKHSDGEPGTLSEDRIFAIHEDSDHNLWVGTLAGGLNLFDRKTGKFKTYKFDGDGRKNNIHSNYVSAILEDKRKNLWIVTSFGIDVLIKKTQQFIHYLHDDKDPNSLINNNTNNILEDSYGLIWVSTREGLSIFDPATSKFTNIARKDGLPDNTVIDMQEDEHHNIWVSTPNGISNVVVSRKSSGLRFHFINYNESDGLQGREFTENSSFKTREGELIFGGGNGFNIFKPSSIHFNKAVPNLAFTDFQLFNQSVSVGEKINGRVILPRSIAELKSLELDHNDNVFSIEFTALSYFNPDKIKLQYRMEGFYNGWITADNNLRKATYNLDAGDYVFKVRAPGNEFWNDKQISLHIKVLPPIWKTTWAYTAYVLFFLSGLFYIRRRGIKNLRAQFSLEKEREEAHRMHELDLMKIKFFTNVSHEFRTPLSLIMAPADKMLKTAADPEAKRQLMLINRNAKRLLNLVNQLLDFRKMEYQELKLHKKAGDIVSFIKDLSWSFNDVADQKGIRFVFDSDEDEFYTSFDHDKVERIMFNLLSNAYKFTHGGGQVSVMLALKQLQGLQYQLEIKVMDTGIGIQTDKKDKIFEPFFQTDIPGSLLNRGSGIGLAITKEFVKLHEGTIAVESEFNQGSCFIIKLPLQKFNKKLFTDAPLSISHEEDGDEPLRAANSLNKEKRDVKKPTLLLVEDNDDFRFYIKDNLKSHFNVIEAEDGKKGWQKALSQHPNLIVSDISMPEMNGIDLCLKIKNDKRTSHIPVILLTALMGEEQQLKGLETGASDYMTKPFNFEILQSKIRNILSQQEYMRKTYQKQLEVKPTEMEVESPDEQFIKKVVLLIDNNIANPNFSIEELSSEMFMSRYTLYKKILAMTGKTPNELVRSMRLKRAAQLLETGHFTISQIAHKVGFKSQKYFVKSFKAEFDTIPSRYVEMLQDK